MFLAASALHLGASAAPGGNGNGNGNGGVNGNGGNSNGNGNGNAYGNGNGGNRNGGNGNGFGNNRGSCFARGTQIRTREGYRPIETLAAGDEVAVEFGGFAPIKAIVSHTLNSVSGRWNGDALNLPVLIRRDALGENSPAADLCITALHAVYVDGFLMPAGELVNGSSITFESADDGKMIDFFNIELDRHDILDVQGASCESLYRAGAERCAPLLRFTGGRSQLLSRLRSAASVMVDRRQPIDVIRDKLEERGLDFARAA